MNSAFCKIKLWPEKAEFSTVCETSSIHFCLIVRLTRIHAVSERCVIITDKKMIIQLQRSLINSVLSRFRFFYNSQECVVLYNHIIGVSTRNNR